jgi:hypothetical protein
MSRFAALNNKNVGWIPPHKRNKQSLKSKKFQTRATDFPSLGNGSKNTSVQEDKTNWESSKIETIKKEDTIEEDFTAHQKEEEIIDTNQILASILSKHVSNLRKQRAWAYGEC